MHEGLTRVLLLGDETKGQVRRVLDRYLPWLEERSEVVGIVLERHQVIPDVEADLCLVFGGDGSLLSAARRLGKKQIPSLGINLGKLGFLAEVAPESFKDAVTKAFAGELREEERLLVEYLPPDGGEPVHLLNDAVMARREITNMIDVSVRVGGHYVTSYAGDGLIMATPVGSTAYSLAAGGPILTPHLHALVLTPLAPHALPVRPLVISSDETVEMTLEGEPDQVVATLTLDGQVHFPIHGGVPLRFRRSEQHFRLLTLEGEDFYRILRRKFGWAGAPRYNPRSS